MQQVLIDCGSNLGQGFEKLSKELDIDSKWNIYMFEPNKRCVDSLKNKYRGIENIHIVEKAVWTKKEKRMLVGEYLPASKEWVGEASNIIGEDYVPPDYIEPAYLMPLELIDCINFSKFLSTFINKKIFLKFDIEGAEFDVLDKMIEDETILLIDTIYVEFHNQLIKDRKDKSYYIDYFNNNKIKYKEWL
jgi:FkbM family methyltransferase